MDATNRNQTFRIAATILIVVGVALLAYSAYTYATVNNALPAVETTAEETATGTGDLGPGDARPVTVPLIAGVLSLGIGVALLFVRPARYADTTSAYTGTPRRVP